MSNLSKGMGGSLSSGGGTASAYDWFVDSVSGNNANAGTTEAAPLQTIAALMAKTITAGQRIGLAKGSSWKEILTIPANDITVGNYGSGALPFFEGADVIPASWTQPDGGLYPNVWQASWTRASVSGTEYLYMWINGALPSRFASSLADLQTNGGWWCAGRTSTSSTIYVKTAADPNSDGNLYEAGKRSWAISGHTATVGSTRTGQNVSGVEGARCSGHYNALSIGPGAFSKCLARWGGIHHTVTESATGEDIICANMPIGYPTAYIPYTAYTSAGAGKSHTAKRCFVIGDTSRTNHQAFYAHTSTTNWDSITLEQCHATIADVAALCSFSDFYCRGFYSKDNNSGIKPSGATFQATHCTFRETQNGINDSGPADTTVRDRTISNCVFYGLGALGNQINLGTRNGSLLVENCIIITSRAYTGVNTTAATSLNVTIRNCIFIGLTDGSGNYGVINLRVGAGVGTITLNNNVYIYANATVNSKYLFSIEGVNYTTLAAWQAATGQDANSVAVFNRPDILTELFSGTVANGDFRMTTTHGINLPNGDRIDLVCGQQAYWDWNARATATGQMSAWPTIPATTAEMRTYVNDPTAWNFYP